MTPTALLAGLLAGCAVLLAAVTLGPGPARRPAPAAVASLPPTSWVRLRRLGAWIRRRCRVESSPLPDPALGGVALLAAAMAGVAPPLAVLVPLAVFTQARVAAQRARCRTERSVASALPDCVDLLVLCTGAGLSLPLAHPLVAERTDGPLGAALAAADRASRSGHPRADAIVEALTPLGERASATARVLADHLRYGIPLAPALQRLVLEVRLDRRRRAEEDARKVPVRLLGPLVTCVLPAFALLTVVPLLVASLQAIPR